VDFNGVEYSSLLNGQSLRLGEGVTLRCFMVWNYLEVMARYLRKQKDDSSRYARVD
jgi:hypothetical protein